MLMWKIRCKSGVLLAAVFGLGAVFGATPPPVYTLFFTNGVPTNCVVSHFFARTAHARETFAGEPCVSIRSTDPTNEYDTSWHIGTARFPVTAGAAFAINVRAAGSVDMTVNYHGTKMQWYDAEGESLKTVDVLGADVDLVTEFGFRCRTTHWIETATHGTVPAGAVMGRALLGADTPNINGENYVLLSAVQYYEAASDDELVFDADWDEPEVVAFSPTEPCADFMAPITFALWDKTGIDTNSLRVVLDGVEVDMAGERGENGESGETWRFTYTPKTPWGEGTLHRITITVCDTQGLPLEEERVVYFTQTKPRHAKLTVRDDGVILREGEPFYPISIFAFGGNKYNGGLESGTQELRENGYTLVSTYLRPNTRPPVYWYTNLADTVAKYGFQICAQPSGDLMKDVTNAAKMRELASNACEVAIYGRDHPATGLWEIGDDTASRRSVRNVRRDHLAIKAIDENVLTSQSDGAAHVGRYQQYAPYTDVFRAEIYPFREETPQPEELALVKKYMEIVYADLERSGVKNRSIWAIPQAFMGWTNWKRFPSYEELRCETLVCLACKARGIAYYTYASGEWGARVKPETWADLCKVTRETHSLEADLVARDAERQPVLTVIDGPTMDALGQFPVTALLKETGRLLAASTATEPVTIRFAMPDGTVFDHRFARNGVLVAKMGGGGWGLWVLTLSNCIYDVPEDKTIAGPVELMGEVVFNIPEASTLTLAGEVRMADDAKVVLKGGGTLTFAHDLTWRGDVDVVAGTVRLAAGYTYENAEGDESVRNIFIRTNGCFQVDDFLAEVTSPRDVWIEDGGYVYIGNRSLFPVRHLYTNGVRVVRGLCKASEGTFFRGTTSDATLAIPYIWTGSGDGIGWRDANNWEDGEPPGEAAQISPGSSARGTYNSFVDFSAASHVVQNASGGGVQTIRGIIYNPNSGAKRLVLSPGTKTAGNRNAIRFRCSGLAPSSFVGRDREIVFDDINIRQEGSENWGFFGRGAYAVRGCDNLFVNNWKWSFCNRNIMPMTRLVFEYLTNTVEQANQDMSFHVLSDKGQGCTDIEIGTGSRFFIRDFVWGRANMHEPPYYRQTANSYFSPKRMFLTLASAAWGSSDYRLEGGELDIREALYVGSMYADDEHYPQYPGGSLRMTGGILRTPFIGCEHNSNYLYLNGGDLYLGAGGIKRTRAVRSDASWYKFKENALPCLQWSGTVIHATANFTNELAIALTGTNATQRIDTAGHDVTLAGAITGSGALVKTGAGDLRLGAYAASGTISVEEGRLVITPEDRLENTTIRIPSADALYVTSGRKVTLNRLTIGTVSEPAGIHYVAGGGAVAVQEYDPTLAQALNASWDFAWTTRVEGGWGSVYEPDACTDGAYAYSGDIGDLGESILETTVTGAGHLEFQWAVSCEEGFDWLEFSVDGEIVRSLTGQTEWRRVALNLGAGEHVLRWTYWKDEMTDAARAGFDRARLDAVSWESKR